MVPQAGGGGTYLGRGRGTYFRVPPPPGCEQTAVKTVPSRRTAYAGGSNRTCSDLKLVTRVDLDKY